MEGITANSRTIWRSLIVTVVFLLVVIAVASAIHPSGQGLLTTIVWLDVIGVIAVGAFLIARAGRPLAGAGAIVCAVAVWLAFFWVPEPSPFVWTVGFFVGIACIVRGTRADTALASAWPILLVRVGFGWAWIDNAQDHLHTGWFPSGGAFATLAKAAVDRKPTYFLDSLYQGFAGGTLLPNKDLWAGLTASGELTFGLLLALGLFGAIGAWGTIWQSANYILVKGLVVHGAYTDKVFLAADVLSLVTSAGLIYGVDASLRHHVPSTVAEALMGAGVEHEPALRPRVQPEAA